MEEPQKTAVAVLDVQPATTLVPLPVTMTVEPSKGGKGAFYPGHPRYGGRVKGQPNKRTLLAREIAAQLKFDPIKLSVDIILSGVLRTKQSDGTTVNVPVPMEERLKTLRDLAQYIQPKLSAVQMTGKDEGPIQVQQLDLVAILNDPKLAAAAQEIALKMAEQQAAQPPADDQEDADD